jgi:glutamate racemase
MILVNRTSAIINSDKFTKCANRYNFYCLFIDRENSKLIIILEKEKITEDVNKKLVKKGLSLIATTDKEIIFNKIKRHFLH